MTNLHLNVVALTRRTPLYSYFFPYCKSTRHISSSSNDKYGEKQGVFMQILGLILVLINVGAIAVPVTAVAVMYWENPIEMIVPPEVEQIVTGMINTDQPVELPQYVSSTYDLSSRTVSAVFSFTNPFNLALRISSVSADVVCAAHTFTLGDASLSSPVQLDEGATAMITIVFTWTQEAEAHFEAEHAEATSVDVELVNLGLDVSGITVQVPESISLNVPLVQ